VLPRILSWAASFFSASILVPGPQDEQVPRRFNLQTSQLIPQAPVGIFLSIVNLLQSLGGWRVEFFWLLLSRAESKAYRAERARLACLLDYVKSLYSLTLRTYMRAALADNDALDIRFAARAGQPFATKYIQFIPITSLMSGYGIEIGFSGSQRCPEIFQPPFEYQGNGRVQRPDFGSGQSRSYSTGVNLSLP
jgi:hypothetical protein